ncbi:hypothetical protein EJ08DRAFT_69337 [Tothia fuscella]|uniref:Uncharacterized protein n=1 Tax=Tothia fuscella TaxID=1048955 RepID=A0A9P4NF48_9PEZI|nr:hypothetical protein EJ08DRAFT_69337 [Tothia fuscella]
MAPLFCLTCENPRKIAGTSWTHLGDYLSSPLVTGSSICISYRNHDCLAHHQSWLSSHNVTSERNRPPSKVPLPKAHRPRSHQLLARPVELTLDPFFNAALRLPSMKRTEKRIPTEQYGSSLDLIMPTRIELAARGGKMGLGKIQADSLRRFQSAKPFFAWFVTQVRLTSAALPEGSSAGSKEPLVTKRGLRASSSKGRSRWKEPFFAWDVDQVR